MRTPPVRQSARASRRRTVVIGLLFAAPFLIGFVALYAYPILASGFYSFTQFNLFQPPEWIGGDNYTRLVGDRRFWIALSNTLILTAVGVPVTIAIALLGAHALNLKVPGQSVFRAVAYLPVVIPVVVGSYLWRWLFNAEYGFVNEFLSWFGLPQPAWLTRPEYGTLAVLIVTLWTVGAATLIYLAALKDVPAELLEAASIDGAGPLRRFRYVTWPILGPITIFQVFTIAISYFQLFTQPYLLTQNPSQNNVAGSSGGGGPGDSMLTIATYIYLSAFRNLDMGYASAMAWILFVIIVVFAVALILFSRKVVHRED